MPERTTKTIALLNEGLQYTMSQRSRLAMKVKAQRHGISYPAVVDRLRSEINAA